MQIEKCKSPIYFSPVLSESPLEGTRSFIGQRLKDRTLKEIPGPGVYKVKSHIVEYPQKWSYIQYSQYLFK